MTNPVAALMVDASFQATPARLVAALESGGDQRIQVDRVTLTNPYGCTLTPDREKVEFGSSTGSSISAAAFDHLSAKLAFWNKAGGHPLESIDYEAELDECRHRIMTVCELSPSDTDILFASSGTDMHLLLGQAYAGCDRRPTCVIAVAASETGSGVPLALGGCHFGNISALGGNAVANQPLGGVNPAEVCTIALREPDGKMRSTEHIHNDILGMIERQCTIGYKVLLVIADCTKTGLLRPSVEWVSSLQPRFGDALQIYVDACQFRSSPSQLRSYLNRGWGVMLTGSKFMMGPSFSAFALLPKAVSTQLGSSRLPAGLSQYSLRAEWPKDWHCATQLNQGANLGLLLRLHAALFEMERYFSIPLTFRRHHALQFSDQANAALSRSRALAPLGLHLPAEPTLMPWKDQVLPLEHRGIFPFVVRHSSGEPFDANESRRIFQLAQTPCSHLAHRQTDASTLARKIQLGQPVSCGFHKGRPVFALRLCYGARLAIDAYAQQNPTPRNFSDLDIAVAKLELLASFLDKSLS